MTHEDPNEHTQGDAGEQAEHAARRGRCASRRSVRLGVTALALVTLGAVAATAYQAAAHGPAGWSERHTALGPEAIYERAAGRAEWVLDAVEANDEQRTEVNAILAEAIDRLHPLVDRHRASRRDFVAELTRPTPDLAALESLRAAEVTLLDEASRDAVDALGRIATVLTPEQRVELVERVDRFRNH